MGEQVSPLSFSVRGLLVEAHRCLRKSELDLGVDLEETKAHVAAALASLDAHADKCRRCWGSGAVKCALCGGRVGAAAGGRVCTRCAGSSLERCPGCAGFGLLPPGQQGT